MKSKTLGFDLPPPLEMNPLLWELLNFLNLWPQSVIWCHITGPLFEPICAICMVGSYASLSVWTWPKILDNTSYCILKSIRPGGPKFHHNIGFEQLFQRVTFLKNWLLHVMYAHLEMGSLPTSSCILNIIGLWIKIPANFGIHVYHILRNLLK